MKDELGILEDEFDDLKDVFKVYTYMLNLNTIQQFVVEMFDVDEDGILNLMEAQHLLRCLGFKGSDANSVSLISCRLSFYYK